MAYSTSVLRVSTFPNSDLITKGFWDQAGPFLERLKEVKDRLGDPTKLQNSFNSAEEKKGNWSHTSAQPSFLKELMMFAPLFQHLDR